MIKYLFLLSFVLGLEARAISDDDLQFLTPFASQRATDFLRLVEHKALFECDIEFDQSLSAKYQTYLREGLDPSSKTRVLAKGDTKSVPDVFLQIRNMTSRKPKASAAVSKGGSLLEAVNKRKAQTHRIGEEPAEWLVSALRSCELGGPFQMQVESLKSFSLTPEGSTEVALNVSGHSGPLPLAPDRYELLVSLKPTLSLEMPAVGEDQRYSYTLILKRKAVNGNATTAGPDEPPCVAPLSDFSVPAPAESLLDILSDTPHRLTGVRKAQMSSFSSSSCLSALVFEVDK